MAREIKFRAWDKEKKKMVTPNDGDFIAWHAPSNWKQWYEVMQYTGQKDKNGKEIYEGDYWKEGKSLGKIVFQDARYEIEWIENRDSWSETLKYHVVHGEVIGNIYEHPILLTKE